MFCVVMFHTLPKQCFVDVIPVLCCVTIICWREYDHLIDEPIDVKCYKMTLQDRTRYSEEDMQMF